MGDGRGPFLIAAKTWHPARAVGGVPVEVGHCKRRGGRGGVPAG